MVIQWVSQVLPKTRGNHQVRMYEPETVRWRIYQPQLMQDFFHQLPWKSKRHDLWKESLLQSAHCRNNPPKSPSAKTIKKNRCNNSMWHLAPTTPQHGMSLERKERYWEGAPGLLYENGWNWCFSTSNGRDFKALETNPPVVTCFHWWFATVVYITKVKNLNAKTWTWITQRSLEAASQKICRNIYSYIPWMGILFCTLLSALPVGAEK